MSSTFSNAPGPEPVGDSDRSRRVRPILLGLVALAIAVVGLAAEVVWTRPVRRSVRAYNDLIAAANRQDLPAIEALCSARYVRDRGIELAPEGGVVGLPRMIHKNFQAWREGPNVWICPTNRVGPVLQFIPEGAAWKFDGTVGLLRDRGMVDTSVEVDPPRVPRGD